MDKKKAVLVIILAMLLAFVVGLFFIKPLKSEPVLIPDEKTEQVDEISEENSSIIQDAQKEEEKVAEDKVVSEVKSIEKPVIKPITKSEIGIQETPIIKPIQVEEATVVEGGIEETEIDAGIYKDANGIVITREFKAKSRAKYSFEGFGIQKAPTK